MAVALYPGSFDPFHLGHLQVVESACRVFDQVAVAVVFNPQKSTFMFSLDERRAQIQQACAHLPTVTVESFSGLVTQLASELGIDTIVKGLRTPADFEVELQMAQTNRSVTGVDTVFIPTEPSVGFISSRYIREISKCGGDVRHMVPLATFEALQRWNVENQIDSVE